MILYRYYTRFRPPMPGAVPRDGLHAATDYGTVRDIDGTTAWGHADYTRPLTEEEIDHYELAAAIGNPIVTKEE